MYTKNHKDRFIFNRTSTQYDSGNLESIEISKYKENLATQILCISANKSRTITFIINITNKTNEVPFSNCCHSQPVRKFQIITSPHVIYHIPSPPICCFTPSEILKMILPRLENFITTPSPLLPSFWGEDTMFWSGNYVKTKSFQNL